ncbi:Cytochrome P450 [Penicillium coprophilum]|uniref:Cytochrome P450 n=1 Tax=Penicillium coprophilum TaxID=36646 RepID=UPI002383308E|nr:Cytochrome P450 [Penicillium coprophilum]KAJ5173474.1 Cytochrome P450 [Penicillium coprophilum]
MDPFIPAHHLMTLIIFSVFTNRGILQHSHLRVQNISPLEFANQSVLGDFASTQVKLAVAKILLAYDVMIVQETPSMIELGSEMLGDLTAELEVRKRKD